MLLTLQQIRDKSPCKEGWEKLLKSLPNYTMETTVSLGDIAKSNNAQDALWCIRCGEFTKDDIEKALAPLVLRAKAANYADVYAATADNYANYADNYANYAAYVATAAATAAAYADAAYADADAAYADAAYADAAANYANYAAADAAYAIERNQQVLDIIAVWPLTR
jgi:hypothetical protein